MNKKTKGSATFVKKIYLRNNAGFVIKIYAQSAFTYVQNVDKLLAGCVSKMKMNQSVVSNVILKFHTAPYLNTQRMMKKV